MFRVLKWATPVVALVFLVSMSAVVRADEAKKETGSVSGTVLDKDGKAAAGVQVRLFHPFERGQRHGGGEGAKVEKQNAETGGSSATSEKEEKPGKGQKGHGQKGDRPQPVASTSTDKDGHFTLNDVPAGKYVVMAMAKGVGGARESVEITAGKEATVELKLKERPANAGANRGEKKAEKTAEKKGEGAAQ